MLAARWLCAGLAWLGSGAVAAGESEPRTVDTQSRIVRNFTAFAGSEANARSLVAGLKAGRTVTISSPGPGARSAATFKPPTPPMGNGSALVSLARARELLAAYGLTRPSPAEIEAALMGGRIVAGGAAAGPVQLPGVLRLRAQGMGWGQIASAMRLRLTSAVGNARGEGGARRVAAPETGAGGIIATALAPGAR
jgi:hypothetical protein